MSDTQLQHLLDDVLGAGLSTNSGVYAGVDPSLRMILNDRGEYEYVGLGPDYRGPVDQLLQVSALGGDAPAEDELARELFGTQHGVEIDPVAGFYVGSFAGWVEEGDIRANGSSGGLATWILLELLRRGDIDGVVHLRQGGENGPLFSYQISRTEEEVRDGAKSRYYPGELTSVLNEIRDIPGRYAIVGIPSFIYELRLLQRTDALFQQRIKYLIGLICGHQKSANYAAYLSWRGGVAPGTLRSIDFRKKVDGEPANRYSTELAGVINGVDRTVVVPQSELFGTDWGLGLFKGNFSDFSQDALNETADIVLGDAWLPRYTADGLGTNVVLVRNGYLLEVLNEGSIRGDVYLEAIPSSDVVRSQDSLVRQNIIEAPYRFRYLASRGEWTPRVRRSEFSATIPLLRRLTQRLRLEISRQSHLAYLDAVRDGDLEVFDRRLRRLTNRYAYVQKATRVRKRLRTEFKSLWEIMTRRFKNQNRQSSGRH